MLAKLQLEFVGVQFKFWRDEVDASAEYIDQCLAIAQDHALQFWLLMGQAGQAWVAAKRGDAQPIELQLEQVSPISEIPDGIKLLIWHQLADALVCLGEYEQALQLLNLILASVSLVNERYIESDYHRLKGICLANVDSGSLAEAEQSLSTAIRISREQSAPAYELRALTSLAEIQQTVGRQDALILGELDQVHSRFTEGLNTKDYRKASALL